MTADAALKGPKSERVEQLLASHSDVLLAILVVVILGAMLIPLPTFLLDLLLTINITLAATILFVSIYIKDATKIPSFPSILLITTLFRLSLNIATTRLILLNANAGEVVRSFGEFVAGGAVVVGIVIFLIITIVQFIVITKGAERVAEVGARFTLDALPGKQMSIDSDFRAGLFDINEARRRRTALQRESQLYGAMDGAMKFVKGDAIAGIIIAAVNLIAGFAIGVLMKGMTLAKAAKTYSILTVGDGLVSQIPALLISIAAGLVVTRVASDEESESNLGKDIGSQVLAQPKALKIVAILLLVFGIIPGLPKIPFIALGLVVAGISRSLSQSQSDSAARIRKAAPAAPTPVRYLPTTALSVELSESLSQHVLSPDAKGVAFDDLIAQARGELYTELGVRVPEPLIWRDRPLPDGALTLCLKDIPIERIVLPKGKSFALASVESLLSLRIEAEPSAHPASGDPAAWIPTTSAQRAMEAGVTIVPTPVCMALQIKGFCQRNAQEFLGIQEVKVLLDDLKKTHPALVEEVVPKIVKLHEMTEILQRLVREEVSIRDLRGILEAISFWRDGDRKPPAMTELVRFSLARQISNQLARSGSRLVVYHVDPEIEQVVLDSVRQGGTAKPFGALSKETLENIKRAIRRELAARPPSSPRPVILTAPEVRPYFKLLVQIEFPRAVVITDREIAPEVVLATVGTISLRLAP